MVARIQIRGEEGVTTGKSGSVANHRALQLESPPFARTYEKLYAHFSSSISTPFLLIDLDSSFRVERRWRNPSLSPSLCVTVTACIIGFLSQWKRGRERESIHPGRSAQRLNRQIKYYDRQIHGNFVGERSIPDGLDISPPTIPIPEFFLQTISTQAIQLILRKLTFRLKKISRFNYRPAFRAAHLDPHTHTHTYTGIGS